MKPCNDHVTTFMIVGGCTSVEWRIIPPCWSSCSVTPLSRGRVASVVWLIISKEDSTQSTETTDHPLKRVYNNFVFINYMVLTPILCPFGIIGNSFVVYVLLKKKNSNSSFIYMKFILLADIVSLIQRILKTKRRKQTLITILLQ
jgi:hypothetical protein